MKSQSYQQQRRVIRRRTVMAIAVIALCACSQSVRAQWTTPDANQNISNTNTGNVGVKTTTPEFPLQVNSSSANVLGLVYTGSISATSGAGIQSLTSTAPSAADQRLGFYTFGTRSGGVSYNPVAIQGFSSQAWTLGSAQGGYLVFSTTPNGSATRTERVRIDQNGYVGVGTTTPGSPFTVIAPSGVREGIQIAGAGNSWIYTDISMTPLGTIATGKPVNFAWSVRKDAFYGNDSSGPSLVMEIWRQGGGFYTPFIINPSGNVILAGANNATNGNVGIGTTGPAYKLDVAGAVNASGGLCLSGDCKTAWSQVGGTQWTPSGSNIFYNSGNVGIGTATAPSRRLEVLGGNVFHQWSTTAGAEYGFYTAINNNHLTSNMYYDGQWKTIVAGKAAVIGTAPATGWAFNIYADNVSRPANSLVSGAQLLTVTMAGNVGVGTSTPDSLAKLHVYGSGTFGQDIQTTTNDWTRLRFMTPNRTWGFFLDGGSGGLGAGKFGLFDYTANLWRMVFNTSGNLGLGTSDPTEKLEVSGNIKVTGTGNITATGTIEGGNVKAKYQDVAEWVDSSQELPAGTVVVLDGSRSNQVIAATHAYDSRVAGVISLKPGLELGEAGEGRVLVASTGRVKVKVDATNGPIQIGDLLVTSNTSGMAMKSQPINVGGVQIHRPGTLIGKALEPLQSGIGEILVLLSMQ